MSLCPGYKHVESFGPEDEYSDEEEVSYVTLDLGTMEPTLVPSSSTYRLIGLDTPTPFLQLSGTIMKGRHETLLGSELLFTDGKDPTDASKKYITPLNPPTTSTRICFHEVRLAPKGTHGPSSSFHPPPSFTPDDGTPDPTLPPSSISTSGKRPPEINWAAESEAASIMLDRLTGKTAPRTRVPRKSGTTTASRSSFPSSSSLPPSSSTPTGRPTRAQRGKAKAPLVLDEDVMAIDRDAEEFGGGEDEDDDYEP